jgi:nucleoid-associated protein YgaU
MSHEVEHHVHESPKTMTVQKGDSLSKIARAIFGRGSLWSCIAGANPSIKDPDVIYEGQTLSLPADCKR